MILLHAALLGSPGLFVIFHVQAQPVQHGPARLAWWPTAVRWAELGAGLGSYVWAIRARRRVRLAVD